MSRPAGVSLRSSPYRRIPDMPLSREDAEWRSVTVPLRPTPSAIVGGHLAAILDALTLRGLAPVFPSYRTRTVSRRFLGPRGEWPPRTAPDHRCSQGPAEPSSDGSLVRSVRFRGATTRDLLAVHRLLIQRLQTKLPRPTRRQLQAFAAILRPAAACVRPMDHDRPGPRTEYAGSALPVRFRLSASRRSR